MKIDIILSSLHCYYQWAYPVINKLVVLIKGVINLIGQFKKIPVILVLAKSHDIAHQSTQAMSSLETDEISTNTFEETLHKCLEEQLNELELLKSMYPNPDDIVLMDKNILEDIKNFLEFKSEFIPGYLNFILKLSIIDLKLELCVNLPSCYPQEEPDVYVRCNQLNRKEQTNLNRELSDYITKNHLGEVSLYSVISWLQDNMESFHIKNIEEVKELSPQKQENFVRLWIFSHHIFCKKKRDHILTIAREKNLTGFCLPGKPGIICVEGFEDECNEWWKNIKSMNWKKIGIRKSEVFPFAERTENQKFNHFQEINFANTSGKNPKHSDMSRFSKYMEENGLIETFNEVFRL